MTWYDLWSWYLCLSGWLLFVIWSWYILQVLRMLFLQTLQVQVRHCPIPAEWPRLSIIIPARDEGAGIRNNLESLLSSHYPHLELIAVNDRSRDDTGAIMDELAARDSRLKVIHIETLPIGWLGKNHALQRGQELATGEWLLFTDGDVLFWPEAQQWALQYALHHQLDFLTMFPLMLPGGFWEDSMITFCVLSFLIDTRPLQIRNSGNLRAYAGIGAFNLVRAARYRELGGHVPLRMEVLDDVRLGQMFKDAGRPSDILVSGPPVAVRWQHSFWQAITGMEKNGFATLRYTHWMIAWVVGAIFAGGICPYLVPLMYPDWRGWGWLAALMMLHLGYGAVAWQTGRSLLVVPTLLFGMLCTLYAFLRSAWITLRPGGVRWRDTFYPLAELRQHGYHNNRLIKR